MLRILLILATVAGLGALALALLPAADTPHKPAAHAQHETYVAANGDLVQLGSVLRTNEGTSAIPGGDTLTCYDSNRNGRVATCKMTDKQSGDVVIARDPSERDVYFGVRQGVQGRKYDTHRNGWRECWTCRTHWGDAVSKHDGISGTDVGTDAASTPAIMGSPEPVSTASATASATATAAATDE